MSSISEIFCKDRFTSRCSEYGLPSGFALDLSTGWGLNDPVQAEEAAELFRACSPWFLVGSPKCTAFSTILNLGTIKEETQFIQLGLNFKPNQIWA